MGLILSKKLHFICIKLASCIRPKKQTLRRDEEKNKLISEDVNTIDDLEDLCDIDILLEMQDVKADHKHTGKQLTLNDINEQLNRIKNT